jgi:hypothetical protein
MTEKRGNLVQRCAGIDQVLGKGMPQSVWRHLYPDPFPHRFQPVTHQVLAERAGAVQKDLIDG